MSIEVFRKDLQFVRIGEIQDSGTIISSSGVIHGRLRSDGLLLNREGGLLGRIHHNGGITASDPRLSGVKVDSFGNILNGVEIIGKLKVDWSSPIPRERAVYAAWALIEGSLQHM